MRRKKLRSVEEIIEDFDEHIHRCGGNYSVWYVGITSNPDRSLFDKHSVNRERDAWIYYNCGVKRITQQVEEFFLRKGCNSATDSSDKSGNYVYAYKKSSH
ncbi:MAG: hypothetical protein ACE5EA_02515 [Nitrospirota bacterium]